MQTHLILHREILATDPLYQSQQKGWLDTILEYIPFL